MDMVVFRRRRWDVARCQKRTTTTQRKTESLHKVTKGKEDGQSIGNEELLAVVDFSASYR